MVCAGIGPAMVGPCCERDSSRGVRPDTLERKDASALDTPCSCDVSVLGSVRSGVNTTIVLVVIDGASGCAVLVASCVVFPCCVEVPCSLGLRCNKEVPVFANRDIDRPADASNPPAFLGVQFVGAFTCSDLLLERDLLCLPLLAILRVLRV